MKLTLLYIKSKAQNWSEGAADEFCDKVSTIIPCKRKAIKSKNYEGHDVEEHRQNDATAVLRELSSADLLVLFDEKGKDFKSSKEFSSELTKLLSRQKNHIVFLIGGAYGHHDSLRARADASWSLSRITMSHAVAQVVALEQIYRGLSIWKGLPYHKE